MADSIERLDDVLKMGELHRYLAALKQSVERLKNRLQVDPRDSDPGLIDPHGPDPSPEGLLISEFQDVIVRSVLNGDPDGSPMKAVLAFKTELAQFHQTEMQRLQREAKALAGG